VFVEVGAILDVVVVFTNTGGAETTADEDSVAVETVFKVAALVVVNTPGGNLDGPGFGFETFLRTGANASAADHPGTTFSPSSPAFFSFSGLLSSGFSSVSVLVGGRLYVTALASTVATLLGPAVNLIPP
jgi:hypothetical protein